MRRFTMFALFAAILFMSAPALAQATAQLGRITAIAGAQRIIQFGVKYGF